MSAFRDVKADSSTPTDGIHRCDTVPPPDGESDAYNAATKVGPSDLIAQLMAQAEAMVEKAHSSLPPVSGDRARAGGPLAARRAEPPGDPPAELVPPAPPIARVYDDQDDDGGDMLDPTSLFGQTQSGATVLLDVSIANVMDGLARGAKVTSRPPAAPRAGFASPLAPPPLAPALAPEAQFAQLDADDSEESAEGVLGGANGAKLIASAVLALFVTAAIAYYLFANAG